MPATYVLDCLEAQDSEYEHKAAVRTVYTVQQDMLHALNAELPGELYQLDTCAVVAALQDCTGRMVEEAKVLSQKRGCMHGQYTVAAFRLCQPGRDWSGDCKIYA